MTDTNKRLAIVTDARGIGVMRATERPVIFPFAVLDGQIVDAGDPDAHQTVLVEFPIFIAVAAEPVAAIVAPFVGETRGDTILPKCPELLDQPVVELAIHLRVRNASISARPCKNSTRLRQLLSGV